MSKPSNVSRIRLRYSLVSFMLLDRRWLTIRHGASLRILAAWSMEGACVGITVTLSIMAVMDIAHVALWVIAIARRLGIHAAAKWRPVNGCELRGSTQLALPRNLVVARTNDRGILRSI